MLTQEIDWRIEPLEHVLEGLQTAMTKLGDRQRLDETFDDPTFHAEQILGLAFVATQTYALGTAEDLNLIRKARGKPRKNKSDWYSCDTEVLNGTVTRIQLINEIANYFKHHDEWQGAWPNRTTTTILNLVGITAQTQDPCHHAFQILASRKRQINELSKIVKDWRERVFKTYV